MLPILSFYEIIGVAVGAATLLLVFIVCIAVICIKLLCKKKTVSERYISHISF